MNPNIRLSKKTKRPYSQVKQFFLRLLFHTIILGSQLANLIKSSSLASAALFILGHCCIANNNPADGTIKWLGERLQGALPKRNETWRILWWRMALFQPQHHSYVKLNSALQDRTSLSLFHKHLSSTIGLLRAVLFSSRLVIGKFNWEQKEIIKWLTCLENRKNIPTLSSCYVSLGENLWSKCTKMIGYVIFQVRSDGWHYGLH